MTYDPRPDGKTQRAYEAFCAALGSPRPAWFDLPAQEREAWRQAIRAIDGSGNTTRGLP